MIETGAHLTKHSQAAIYKQGDLSVGDLEAKEDGNLEGLFYTDFLLRDTMQGIKVSHELLVRQ